MLREATAVVVASCFASRSVDNEGNESPIHHCPTDWRSGEPALPVAVWLKFATSDWRAVAGG